jgi:hypothetical protein
MGKYSGKNHTQPSNAPTAAVEGVICSINNSCHNVTAEIHYISIDLGEEL